MIKLLLISTRCKINDFCNAL